MTDLLDSFSLEEPAASEAGAEALGKFSTHCIDATYGTRSCSDEKAHAVLAVTPVQVRAGLVEALVHRDSGAMVGFYALKVPSEDADYIELGNLFVHPDHQRQGIGTLLFQRALDRARALSLQLLTLSSISLSSAGPLHPYGLDTMQMETERKSEEHSSITYKRGKRKCRMTWVSDPGAELFYSKLGAHLTGRDVNLLNPTLPVPLFEISL